MISRYSLGKALLSLAKTVCEENSIDLALVGDNYDKSVQKQFVEVKVIYGADTSEGYNENSYVYQKGIYQVEINAPKSDPASLWSCAKLTDKFVEAFSFGRQLVYNDQVVEIQRSRSGPAITSGETHNTQYLSVYFNVIN